MPSEPGENRGECFGEFENRSVTTRDAVEYFHLLENSHKLCGGLKRLWRHGQHVFFLFFLKSLFLILTKRKTIYEARTVNSHNSETVNHIADVIFELHSPMKTHL